MKIKQLFRISFVILALSTSFSTKTFAQSNGFEVVKNLELINMIYQDLDMYYVDEPAVGKLMKVGIDAMLQELDPYTNFYAESNIEDYRLMTTGQYGGIGAVIRKIDDHVVISEPYEDNPAIKAGVKAGDIILSIDGIDMTKKSSDEVSTALRGPKGSTITVKLDRPGVGEKTVKITRDEIKILDVPYAGIVSEGVGYIKLNSFTQTAYSEVKKAYDDLKSQGMKKLVFDLRGNGGGLLIEAVKIVNMFVPKGQTVVSTKGRIKEENRVYTTLSNPEDTEIPVAVLVDENSASASEIVSGSLQDLDRAVIVGNTTYGKGLVQRTMDLKYGSKIKLTIAKYYTPSGRCIQKLDYASRKDGQRPAEFADSLISIFHTANGRVVKDARGIEPDVTIPLEMYSRLTAMLVIENVIFDFSTQYAAKHATIDSAQNFTISDELYTEFKKFAESYDFTYTTASEEMLKKVEETAEEEGYFDKESPEYKALLALVIPSKERDLEKFKPEIEEMLANEIVSRYFYQRGRALQSFNYDKALKKAIETLNNETELKHILTGK
ncbi:MAG: S41 family peptidase [Crocinitomicaceae bacterium]